MQWTRDISCLRHLSLAAFLLHPSCNICWTFLLKILCPIKNTETQTRTRTHRIHHLHVHVFPEISANKDAVNRDHWSNLGNTYWSNLGKWHLLKMMAFSQGRHFEKGLDRAGLNDKSAISNLLQLLYVCIENDATAHYSLNVKVTTDRSRRK